MNLHDKLSEKFNVEPMEPMTGELITAGGDVILPKTDQLEDNVDYDYEKTRSNLHNLLLQGQEALLSALEVAKQSEHPRAFEVVGNLIKQLSDVNHQLMDLSEKKQKLSSKDKKEDVPSQVTNNAIFVGSTTELNNMLKNMTGGS